MLIVLESNNVLPDFILRTLDNSDMPVSQKLTVMKNVVEGAQAITVHEY